MFNTAGGDQINFGVGIFLTKGGGVKFCSDPEGVGGGGILFMPHWQI